MTPDIPFEFCVDSSIPLRHFPLGSVPVYLGMYSHPGLASKDVSIPHFGFSLCPSLYMRRFCLIPVNPPSHLHHILLIHCYRTT